MALAHDPQYKLWQMIHQHRFAMLATLEPNGDLRSRPMTMQQLQYDGSLWFFAKADSGAVLAIYAHPQVCLTYGNSAQADFVAVGGHASISTDTEQKKSLWNSAVQAWFPEGAESLQVVLIHVTPVHGEYWDSKDSKLVQLFSMARAAATGTTPRRNGEHKSVSM